MRSTERRIFLTALALAAWWGAVLAPRAEAYIDPSAGGMLVQLLLAGTAGVAVIVRLFWMRIRRMVGLPTEEPGQTSEASASGPSEHDPV